MPSSSHPRTRGCRGLPAAAAWALKWTLGATPLGTALGGLVAVGTTVTTWVSTGSVVPGARLVGSALWLAGPVGTVLALAAEGVAAAGSRTRTLTAEEYRWADERVFRGTLPPRERLVLTDTAGMAGRAFTLPRLDGKITLNLGTAGYADPRQHPGGVYGEVFVHELVHAWQLHHSASSQALLLREAAAQVRQTLTGADVYDPGDAPRGAFRTYGPEQQAEIVSRKWFRQHHTRSTDGPEVLDSPAATGSPWFRYIDQDLRART